MFDLFKRQNNPDTVYYYVAGYSNNEPTVIGQRFYSMDEAERYRLGLSVSINYRVYPLAIADIRQARDYLTRKLYSERPSASRISTMDAVDNGEDDTTNDY